MLIAKYSRKIPTSKKVSPYLPKPKMLLLSMDSKLLSSMHNAHINTYVELAFTKSQSGEIFTFYLQIRVFKSFFVCLSPVLPTYKGKFDFNTFRISVTRKNIFKTHNFLVV